MNAERIDFAADDEDTGDPVADSMAQEWRGLPLCHSKRAQLAATRYGLACMAISDENQINDNGTYAGMPDDVLITIFCALCGADAGKVKEKSVPKEMRGVLRVATLNRTKGRLAAHLGDFVDAFDIDPVALDEESITKAQGLMFPAADSEVGTGDDDTPGKHGGEDSAG